MVARVADPAELYQVRFSPVWVFGHFRKSASEKPDPKCPDLAGSATLMVALHNNTIMPKMFLYTYLRMEENTM